MDFAGRQSSIASRIPRTVDYTAAKWGWEAIGLAIVPFDGQAGADANPIDHRVNFAI